MFRDLSQVIKNTALAVALLWFCFIGITATALLVVYIGVFYEETTQCPGMASFKGLPGRPTYPPIDLEGKSGR